MSEQFAKLFFVLVGVACGLGFLIAGGVDERAGVEAVREREVRAACASYDWDQLTCERVMLGRVWIGMTPEQAWLSWGTPTVINRMINAGGAIHEWVYESSKTKYLYFDGRVLKEIRY